MLSPLLTAFNVHLIVIFASNPDQKKGNDSAPIVFELHDCILLWSYILFPFRAISYFSLSSLQGSPDRLRPKVQGAAMDMVCFPSYQHDCVSLTLTKLHGNIIVRHYKDEVASKYNFSHGINYFSIQIVIISVIIIEHLCAGFLGKSTE